MNKLTISGLILNLLLHPAVYASKHKQDGYALVQDEHLSGVQVELEEDQDEVYHAVKQGKIKPFSELSKVIEQQLNGRLIKVELEEDNDEWIYELKLLYQNRVIEVEYDAAKLYLMKMKGHNLIEVIKKTPLS